MHLIITIFLFLSISLSAFAGDKIRVAITIDDLPSHGKLPINTTRLEIAQKMLKTLKNNDIPEVYGFVNGKRLEEGSDLIDVLKLWRKNGFPLGNHTFSHPSLTKSNTEDFEKDIDANEKLLVSLSNGTNWRYFRYPFLQEGNTLEKRNAIRQYLTKKGYVTAQVTIDFEDWSWNEPYARCLAKADGDSISWLKKTYLKNAVDVLERAKTLSRFLYKRQIKHILLLHIGAFDAEMLEQLIQSYRERGVEFIPLSEAVRDDAYAFDPGHTFDGGAEFIYQVLKARGLHLKDAGLDSYQGYPEEQLKKVCL